MKQIAPAFGGRFNDQQHPPRVHLVKRITFKDLSDRVARCGRAAIDLSAERTVTDKQAVVEVTCQLCRRTLTRG